MLFKNRNPIKEKSTSKQSTNDGLNVMKLRFQPNTKRLKSSDKLMKLNLERKDVKK